jgi:hypothetical protein
MAHDVFVHWKDSSKKPTREEVEHVIRDFFGQAASEIFWGNGRFFVTLASSRSNPLAHLDIIPEEMRRIIDSERERDGGGRHMEVWLGDDCLDVITRRQDEFVHACQDGLAKVFARVWEGRIES